MVCGCSGKADGSVWSFGPAASPGDGWGESLVPWARQQGWNPQLSPTSRLWKMLPVLLGSLGSTDITKSQDGLGWKRPQISICKSLPWTRIPPLNQAAQGPISLAKSRPGGL